MEETQSIFTKIGRGTFWLFLGAALGYIAIFFYRIIIARYLGPESLGLFSLTIMVTSLAITATSFGMGKSAIKFISDYRASGKNYNKIFSTGFIFMIFLGVLGSLSVFLLSGTISEHIFKEPGLKPLIKIASISILFAHMSGFMSSSFIGLQKMKTQSMVLLSEKIVKLVSTLALFLLGFNILAAVGGYVIAFMSTSLLFGSIIYLKKYFRIEKYDFKIARKMYRFGLPLFLGGVAGTLLSTMDTFFIGVLLDSSQVGLYNAVLPILWMLGLLIAMLSTALFPAFSEINSRKNRKLLDKLLNRSIRYALIILIPLTVGSIVLSKEAILILFGSEYLPSLTAFRILSIGALFLSIGTITNSFLSGIGRPRTIMKISVSALVINIILNFFLIQLYGINGAAAATVISLFLIFVMHMYSVRDDVNVRLSYIYKPILASGIMIVIILYVKKINMGIMLDTVITVISGAIIYFAVMFLIKGITKKDVQNVVDIFK